MPLDLRAIRPWLIASAHDHDQLWPPLPPEFFDHATQDRRRLFLAVVKVMPLDLRAIRPWLIASAHDHDQLWPPLPPEFFDHATQDRRRLFLAVAKVMPLDLRAIISAEALTQIDASNRGK